MSDNTTTAADGLFAVAQAIEHVAIALNRMAEQVENVGDAIRTVDDSITHARVGAALEGLASLSQLMDPEGNNLAYCLSGLDSIFEIARSLDGIRTAINESSMG